MRRIPLILGLVMITGLIIHDVYEFFATDEGIRYFSSDPRRLLYVMGLGVAGGIVALWISRMSPRSQRKLKLATLGGFGTLLFGGLACFGYLFYDLGVAAPMEALKWPWIAATIASLPSFSSRAFSLQASVLAR